ncbi:MAG: zf-TFIIB domain-containing protein [Pseudomonadota bacterium]
MRCPIDGAELKMSDRQGIEIDYCPKCRGIWLDRGELDKIIERSGSAGSQHRGDRDSVYREREYKPHKKYKGDHRGDYRRDYDDDRRYDRKPYYKKRKSFLSEIFDLD